MCAFLEARGGFPPGNNRVPKGVFPVSREDKTFAERQKFRNGYNKEVPYENQDHFSLHGVQTAQLQHHEEQEEHTRQTRNEQILQILQKTHSAQRDEVTGVPLFYVRRKIWQMRKRKPEIRKPTPERTAG